MIFLVISAAKDVEEMSILNRRQSGISLCLRF